MKVRRSNCYESYSPQLESKRKFVKNPSFGKSTFASLKPEKTSAKREIFGWFFSFLSRFTFFSCVLNFFQHLFGKKEVVSPAVPTSSFPPTPPTPMDERRATQVFTGIPPMLVGELQAKGVYLRPKFTPSNSSNKKRNPSRTSLEEMKRVQLKQLEFFRKHAQRGEWSSLHKPHFDWFMFPLEDGSKRQYNVLEEDVAELKADKEWLSRYRESVLLLCKAWGWDVLAKKDFVARGAAWTNWDIRLCKMIRSTWLFGQSDLLEGLQAYAHKLKPHGGFRYGGHCLDEIFFMS